jgi:MFS family permease
VLGDWLVAGSAVGQDATAAAADRAPLDRLFLTAAALAAVSLICAAWSTRAEPPPPPRRRRPPVLWLVRRYHPGWLLLMGVTMGIGVALPGTFVRTYTAELGIGYIRLYFLVFTITAVATRLATRHWTDRLGVRPMILAGTSAQAAGVLAFLAVDRYAMLALPAALAGVAHALLFPALVAGGALAFPARYRGLATTLMLAMMDTGVLFGAPSIGWLLHTAADWGLAPYPTMFASVTAVLLVAMAAYTIGSRPRMSPSSTASGPVHRGHALGVRRTVRRTRQRASAIVSRSRAGSGSSRR